MTKRLGIAFFTLLNLSVFGQDVSITGFGTPLLSVSELDQKAMVAFGGGGAMLISNRLFIGGFGEGMGHYYNGTNATYEDYYLNLGHGGPWLGFIFRINKYNTIEASTQLAWGSAYFIKNMETSYSSSYFLTKPIIEYNRKLCTMLKVGLGVAYSIYKGVENPVYTDSDLSQASLMLSLKFGWFN